MCFNETASLVAFSIGVISTIILFQMKLYNFSIFYISIFTMQLVEYYAHKSLTTNNIAMNKMSAYFGYFLILSQPIILSYLTYNNIDKNFQNTLIFLCLSFITFGLFYFGIAYFVSYNRKSKNISILPILTFLLGLTILYMMFETKQINTFKTSIFGSLWCYLCVIAGPLVILNKNLY